MRHFSLCDNRLIMRQLFHYATTLLNMGHKYGLYSPKIFDTNLQIGTPNKIFSHSIHPHSNHFTYKYQNFSFFISNIWFINHTRFKCLLSLYMVYKPYTNKV